MFRIFSFSVLVLLLMVATVQRNVYGQSGKTAVDGPKEITLRILTYNIYHGETTDGRVDMDLFADIIREFNPDLVGLQEVDKNATRTGVIDITEELSKRTGLKGYFCKHRDFQGGGYGNAILSRFPITDLQLIEGYKTGVNGITIPFAKVEISPDHFLYFSSSHLTTNPEERPIQARQLSEHYTEVLARAPTIITGDLNAEPHHDELQLLFREFAEADTTYANTFSTRSGLRKKIDFILYPDNDQWEVLETKVVCREDASDHCAFFAVLKYEW